MEDIGSKPPPGELALVQGFINTTNFEPPDDRLAEPEQLEAWLRQHGLLEPGVRLDRADVRAAQAVREALRALLLANNGWPADPGAVETLNRAAGRARVVVRFEESGAARLEPAAGGIDGAIGSLLGIVYRAMADGTWERFKACRLDTCHWAFYDASKNRSGAWCTMAECGNRAKARAFRARKRASRSSAGAPNQP